ncbi:MAG TPA: hypothetical protein PLN21_13565 [Gemmatales bacterium]|nr:hypothetical protein [Gemmatales bacterium]
MLNPYARWLPSASIGMFTVVLLAGAALPPHSTSTWRNDWNAFVKELKPYLQRQAPLADYQATFEGQTVTWVGEVYCVELLSDLPGVQFKMPDTQVILPNGLTFEFDPILRPWNLQRNQFKKWAAVKPGDLVRFRTTLKERNSIYTVVSLSHRVEKIGDKPMAVVSIAADGAELIEVMKRK